MTYKILLCVFSLTLFTSSVQARIGETLEECTVRYGAVVEKRPAKLSQSDPDAHLFSKSGVTVWVEFRQGKAWRIAFRKLEMTDAEVEALLRANMPVGGWGAALDVNGKSCRRSLNTELVANLIPARSAKEPTLLEIAKREYAEAHYASYLDRVHETKTQTKEQGAPAALDGF